ncbi:MAG TPA: hypothetical protein VLL98_05470 [Rickettsiales bacterium]|nr:hypothetical protein [Rickettsiales bacterium]
MIQNIIDDDICKYTVDIMQKIGVKGNCKHKTLSQKEYNLILNPYSKCVIKFIPKDILSELPLADNIGNWLENVCNTNSHLRCVVNESIGNIFYKTTKESRKKTLLEEIKTNRKLFLEVLKVLREYSLEHYDLDKDSIGLYRWLEDSETFFKTELTKETINCDDNIEFLSLAIENIINHFGQVIYDKTLWKMFWTKCSSNFKHVLENYSQMLFYTVCNAWLTSQNSNIQLFLETDTETKQLYFRFCISEKNQIIVQVKHSNNHQGLEVCYERQLETHKNSSNSKCLYVVMNFDDEKDSKSLKKIKLIENPCCKIIEIDVAQKDEKQMDLFKVVEYENSNWIEDTKYKEEKSKGGKNSYQRYKPLKNKVEELCKEELNKNNYESALKLSEIIALKLERDFPNLLNDFEPYKIHLNDGGGWIKPTFYGWCNEIYKLINGRK